MFEKGDSVSIECVVTKVLADGFVVVRLPGVDTPVTISEKSVALSKKATVTKGTDFKVPKGYKPPRDTG